MSELNAKEQIGFVEVNKTKSITEYELSRYACYLIVQNGDSRKETIAPEPVIIQQNTE